MSGAKPRPDFQLHRRGAGDLAGLADLWVASWQDAMPEIDFGARRAWFLDRLRGLEAQGWVTVCAAAAGDTLRGFVILDPASGALDQLAVDPAAKGTGVAALLMTEARRLSPAGLALVVNQDNRRALRFYAREGFAICGEGMNATSGLPTWRMRWVPA